MADVYKYEIGFRHSAIYLIRENHLRIDPSGIDFTNVRVVEIPNPIYGEVVEEEVAEVELANIIDLNGNVEDLSV